MERLIGGGYINTAFIGLRPWTRMSCAQMLIEMNSEGRVPHRCAVGNLAAQEGARHRIRARAGCLGRPSRPSRMQLDSVYTRVMDIAGTPVNDSYHFGQTLINDYGRPYWQGVNNITGFSASANDRPLRLLRRWRISIRAHDSWPIRFRCGR